MVNINQIGPHFYVFIFGHGCNWILMDFRVKCTQCTPNYVHFVDVRLTMMSRWSMDQCWVLRCLAQQNVAVERVYDERRTWFNVLQFFWQLATDIGRLDYIIRCSGQENVVCVASTNDRYCTRASWWMVAVIGCRFAIFSRFKCPRCWGHWNAMHIFAYERRTRLPVRVWKFEAKDGTAMFD